MIDLSAFARWAHYEGHIDSLPWVPVNKLPQVFYPILSDDELDQVFATRQLSPHTEIGTRNRALIAFMLDTGVRRSELANLNLDDLDLAEHKAKHCAKEGQRAHPHKGYCPGLLVGDDGRCDPDPCQNVDCGHLTTDCSNGVCVNGTCESEPANSGANCDDGSACMSGATCQSDGTCGGGTTTACDAPEICQGLPGTCDETTGECAYTNEPDGTICPCEVFGGIRNCICDSGACVCRPSGTPCDINAPADCCSGCCLRLGDNDYVCCS